MNQGRKSDLKPPWTARILYGVAVLLTLAAAIAYVSPHLLAETDIPENFPAGLHDQAATAYEDVSLVAVLADPAAFDGRRLRTEGYLVFRYEMDGLFLDEGGYESGLTHNAIWVERPRAWRPPVGQPIPSYRRYAAVTGVFDAAQRGHRGTYSGTLSDIRAIAWRETMLEFERQLLADWLKTVCAPSLCLLAILSALSGFAFDAPRLTRRLLKR